MSNVGLIRANEIKRARAALLHRMYLLAPRESSLFAAEVLEDVPDVLRTLTLDGFLDRVRLHSATQGARQVRPSGGKSDRLGTRRLIESADVEAWKALGDLSEDERSRLAFALEIRAGRFRSEALLSDVYPADSLGQRIERQQ